MVLPSCSISQSDETVDKDHVSVKSKVIRKTFPKKARKLSRRRRKAKRRSEKYIRERKQMASLGKGPYDYYWGNYFRCVKWVQNHQASYWKSRAQALEYENQMLRSLIENGSTSHPNLTARTMHNHDCRNSMPMTDVPNLRENTFKHGKFNFDSPGRDFANGKVNPLDNETANDSEEFEFEVDDNMIEFFTQSMKHKMELQRERNQDNDKDANLGCAWGSSRSQRRKSSNVETKDDESSFDACMMGLRRVLPTHCFEGNETVESKDLEDILFHKAQREEKEKLKKELFGKSASKILGMETAVQLNFRQFCANKHPVTWPIIPLNM
ncbi:hypothetical protein R5R35_011085 [Gryllus longicercus]|uniref:Gem-associated protein 8 n=2 Tax=Gryllus longicercus TaxID=2509291 RepID=A0AAN9ZAH2_9ORTH